MTNIPESLPAISRHVNLHSAKLMPDTDIPPANGGIFDIHDITYTPQIARFGEDFLQAPKTIDSISIIPPQTPDLVVDAAIQKTKEDKYFFPNPAGRLIIANPEAAEKLKTALPDLPVISSAETKHFIKEDEVLKIYGTLFKPDTTAGTFHRDAIIIDRLILGRNRTELAPLIHINSEINKIASSPIRHAGLLKAYDKTIYVQKNYGAAQLAIGKSLENASNPLATALSQRDLEPSQNIVAQRWLIDHTPLSTGEYGQELTTLIIAKELADIGYQIGKVTDAQTNINNLLSTEATQDYEDLLLIIGQELHSKGKRLIDATPSDYRAINSRLAENPRLGQLLPSLYTLLKEDLIDYDRVAALEKRLSEKQYTGFTPNILKLKPAHLIDPSQSDNEPELLKRIESLYLEGRSSPPTGDYDFFVDTAPHGDSLQAGKRIRENDDSNLDMSAMGISARNKNQLWYFNYRPDSRNHFMSEIKDIEKMAEERLTQPDVVASIAAYTEAGSVGDAARVAEKYMPKRVVVASPDSATREAAAPYASFVVDQNEVFRGIDWKGLIEAGILPNDRAVIGTLGGKGATLLAADLYSYVTGILEPNSLRVHVDTDIDTHDAQSRRFLEHPETEIPPYDVMKYMIIPFMLSPINYEIVKSDPGKTGEARQGEVKLPGWMRMQNYGLGLNDIDAMDDPFSVFMRHYGEMLTTEVWPTPGERISKGIIPILSPRTTSTASDFDEKMIAHYLALTGGFNSIKNFDPNNLPDTRYAVAQIAVPSPKGELGDVDRHIDTAEVVWCGDMAHQMVDFYRQLHRDFVRGISPLEPAVPAGFSTDHIKLWNKMYAGYRLNVPYSVQPEYENDTKGIHQFSYNQIYRIANGPNGQLFKRFGFPILPSVKWLDENGFINHDVIGNVNNFSTLGKKITRSGRGWQ